MRHDAFRAGVAAACAAWALSACAPAPPPPEQLIVASSTSGYDSLLHIALAQGFMRDEGVEVVIAPAPYGKAALEMVIAGKADLATAADVPFAVAAANGGNVVATAVLASSSDNGIVARRDRGIATPADLSGKRLGVALGTSADYFAWAFLVRHRMAPDSVQLVGLAPQKLAEAVASGAVDAVAAWQPHLGEAERALGANARTFLEATAYTQSFLLIADGNVAARRGPALHRVMRALIKAEAFAKSHPEEALTGESRRLGVERAALAASWAQRTLAVSLPQSLLMTLEDQARWAAARGYAPGTAMPNMLARLETAPLAQADRKRVSVARRAP